MITKICRSCGASKTLEEYPPDKRNTLGKGSDCYGCCRAQRKAYYQTRRYKDYMREYSKVRYPKDRVKIIARGKTRYAVKTGKLIKPTVCDNCHEESQLDAHHEDYSKPLEVSWLCNLCHKIKHGRVKDKALLAQKVQA